jgi:two-component system sensor histidine kinase CpxA
MRSLFVKVFLWFWLATTLSGLALFLIGFATQTGPPAEHRRRAVEQWRHLTGQTLALYGETATALLEGGGRTALDEYTALLERTSGIRVVLFLRGKETIFEQETSTEARRLAERAADSRRTEVEDAGAALWLATRVLGPRGEPYVVAGVLAGPRLHAAVPPPPTAGLWTGFLAEFPRFARGFGMPALVSFFVGGLVCLGLAWRLTAPLRRLRTAAQRLAGGDLTARVGAGPVKGRDEIAALGRDFNLMAGRIEELMTAQRHLLRDISHELRSPLARLNVALELARQRSGEEATTALDRIGREAERLNDLIGQLLTLTQLESGGDRIAREPVSLTHLVQAIAADANFEAQTRQRTVRAVVDDELTVQGSEEMLRQGVENVVRNAVRYTAESTQVEIAVSHRRGDSGEAAVIRVRDHGPGVPEGALSRMFLPFYRVADARDRQTGGTGIGLAITERAIRLHKGTVAAANAPDGGLIVEITLPITDRADA